MTILIAYKNLPIHFLSEFVVYLNNKDLFTHGILSQGNLKLAIKIFWIGQITSCLLFYMGKGIILKKGGLIMKTLQLFISY